MTVYEKWIRTPVIALNWWKPVELWYKATDFTGSIKMKREMKNGAVPACRGRRRETHLSAAGRGRGREASTWSRQHAFIASDDPFPPPLLARWNMTDRPPEGDYRDYNRSEIIRAMLQVQHLRGGCEHRETPADGSCRFLSRTKVEKWSEVEQSRSMSAEGLVWGGGTAGRANKGLRVIIWAAAASDLCIMKNIPHGSR